MAQLSHASPAGAKLRANRGMEAAMRTLGWWLLMLLAARPPWHPHFDPIEDGKRIMLVLVAVWFADLLRRTFYG